MGRAQDSGKPKPSPYSSEALEYQAYKKRKADGWYMSRQQGESPEHKRWREYEERNKKSFDDIKEYKAYKDEPARIIDDPRTEKFKQFETDTFGGTPDKSATIEDLYMSADKHRKSIKDLFIDPNKKKTSGITGVGGKGGGGGGKKGGGKKTGGKTGGPGNPNTGGFGGAGDVNL